MKCLNLGCGERFHRAWTNVDFVAADPSIISYNLREGVPFPDDEFDVVYHSHLLEHFPKSQVMPFLRECFRVLKSGGGIRVALPDLERIARTYLEALEAALSGDEQWQRNYEWMMLELYDQTVRERSGGEMGTRLSREEIPNKEFILSRIGMEARRAFESAARARGSHPARTTAGGSEHTFLRRLYRLVRDQSTRREAVIRRVLGTEYELLQLGRFRRGGEIHLWMYDRYSLARALQDAGFKETQSVGPAESRITGWADYGLDTEADGTVYKPDSLFMEATK